MELVEYALSFGSAACVMCGLWLSAFGRWRWSSLVGIPLMVIGYVGQVNYPILGTVLTRTLGRGTPFRTVSGTPTSNG